MLHRVSQKQPKRSRCGQQNKSPSLIVIIPVLLGEFGAYDLVLGAAEFCQFFHSRRR